MPPITVRLPRKAERVARRSGLAREVACDEGVDALKAPNSKWPVATGRSKRAWQRTGALELSEIYNPAFYASYVERGIPNKRTRGAARRTLKAADNKITRAARNAEMSERRPAVERQQAAVGEILSVAARRQVLEVENELYNLFLLNRRQAGRRAPRIPAALTRLSARLERQASRGS